MTESVEALRALVDQPSSPPPSIGEIHERASSRRRRRTTVRVATAVLASVAAAVAIVPLLRAPDQTARVVAGPPETTMAVTPAAAGTHLEFPVPEGWSTLFAVGNRMVVTTRPLSDADLVLALLGRDDASFAAFPVDGVVVVVGGDPLQAKYGFKPDGTPIDPGPAYALGAERALPGGVRFRRGDVPQSDVRIASYAGASAPASRLRQAEAIAAGLRLVTTGDPSVRPPPPPPGSRPGLPSGGLPVPEAGLPEVARVPASGSTLLLVAGSDCAYLRWVDSQTTLPGYQPLGGACGTRPAGTATVVLGGALLVMRGPDTAPSTVAIFRAGAQVRKVSARLADGRSVPATVGVDGWGLVASDGRLVALTGVDASGRPVPEQLVG